MIETLEARQHYARIGVDRIGSTLIITGTDRVDHVEIGAGKAFLTLSLNGRSTPISTTNLKTIRIGGGRGDDILIVSPNIKIRASVDGGAGNDQIGGGGGSDTLAGGRGNDSIAGHNGNDYIDGGSDDDVLYDVDGINVIHGGGGNDRATSDDYNLGSGIETRVNNSSGLYPFSDVTDLKTVNGRLVLTRTGTLASSSNSVRQTGPTLLRNGQYEVTEILRTSGGSSSNYEDEWDVTDIASKGIVLSAYDPTAGGLVFSLPYLLPTA